MKLRIAIIAAAGLAAVAIFTLAAFADSPQDWQACLECHGQPNNAKPSPQGDVLPPYVDGSELATSTHRYVGCLQCHPEPHSPRAALAPVDKLAIAEECGNCHQYERDSYRDSIHAESLAQGRTGAAGCLECHSTMGGPHGIAQVLSPDSPTYRRNIAETCSRCHGNEKLMASYGILEKVYESYLLSYHGKVQTLAKDDLRKLDMATCTNCHGVHDIKAVADPSSPVASLSNLKDVCAQCHPGADENFAKAMILGHEETNLKDAPVVYYTEMGFTLLTAGVVASGLLLTSLAFVHYVRHRYRDE